MDEECTGHWEVDFSGTFSGHLTESTDTIESEENWVCKNFTVCDFGDACSTKEPIHRDFVIQISGDQITGTTLPLEFQHETEDGLVWTFTAAKE